MAFGPFLASQSGPENDPQQRQFRQLQILEAQQLLQARQRQQQEQALMYQGLRGLGAGGQRPEIGGQGQQQLQMPQGLPPPQGQAGMGGGGLPFPHISTPSAPPGMAWGGGARPPGFPTPGYQNVSAANIPPPSGPSPGGAFLGQQPQQSPPPQINLPPQQQQQSAQLATAIGGQVPMGMRGALDVTQLASAIEKAAPPGTPDEVKMGAIVGLYNLMAPQAKEDFTRQWNAFKFGVQETDKGLQREEARREHDLLAGFRGEEIATGRQREAREARSAADLQTYREGEAADRTRRTDIMERAGPARVQAAADKAALPQLQRVAEDLQLADEADALREMVEKNPRLVGTPGIIGRAGGAIAETAGNLVGQDWSEAPDVAAFANRLNLLQARLQKPLLGSRYYSGMAQKKLDEIVPGLKSLQNPSKVKAALEDISRTLRDQADVVERTVKATRTGVTTEYQNMSDEDLKRQLGIQ